MKSFLLFIWEVAKIVVIALVIVVPIRYFLFQPFFVKGQSMEPNFENGDYLIVDEISYRFHDPQRGDVVVFKYPYDLSQRYIKRIIGLSGEKVEIKDGKIIIINEKGSQTLDESKYLSFSLQTWGNETFDVGQEEYFVLGDNRSVSADSRSWGLLPRNDIIGKVVFRAWPLAVFEAIKVPIYYMNPVRSFW